MKSSPMQLEFWTLFPTRGWLGDGLRWISGGLGWLSGGPEGGSVVVQGDSVVVWGWSGVACRCSDSGLVV